MMKQTSVTNESFQSDYYTSMSRSRGYAYVFNYTFKNQLEARAGAERDSNNLRETLSMFGYEVIVYEDMTKELTMETILSIRNDPILYEVDSIIFFFLSHGLSNYIFYTCEGQKLSLDEIRRHFVDSKCPQLKKKPKIFMANFCRGADTEQWEYDGKVDVPRDMVTIHATTEGVKALRSRVAGTIFVKSLCQAFRNVNNGVMEIREMYAMLQVQMMRNSGTTPMWEDYSFSKKFYFQRL
ncbi:caspase-2-like 2 [Homarus americanus]|uniref:Caspase-2-like 2 n=2 Tax=Homarus americanus TaxID=6706 RepID=A0A8J5K028_HOMAM|nr:caspase-2-like 2 [Homarus americanus]